MFPDDPGTSSQKPHNWRQQHRDTLNAIKRDRERSERAHGTNWTEFFPGEKSFEYEMHQSSLVQCPTCHRKFNTDAASHHIPHCRQKANEKQFHYENPKYDPRPSGNSFQRAREYSKNFKMKEHNDNNCQDESFKYWSTNDDESIYSDESEITNSDNESDFYSFFSSPLKVNGCLSSRSSRKSTLPDIYFDAKKIPQSSKPRRNTTSDIYENKLPSFSKKFESDKIQRGCNNCIRVYGFEAAKIFCSCGFKKSTNIKPR